MLFVRSTLRSVSTTARVASLKSIRLSSPRHYSSTMHDNDPEVLEMEKKRNLTGVQHKTSTPHEHAPGWNESLASASEASVKADQSTGTTDELQRRTVNYIHARHSPDEAGYSHDSVQGPLSSAQGTEDTQAETDTYVLKKTVRKEETTEMLKNATASEAA